MIHVNDKYTLVRTPKMKKLTALALILTACTATAEIKLVPLDMELGYWETTTKIEESEMMQGAVESDVDGQCITPDSFKDMEKQMTESMGGEDGQNCQFEVTKSTSREMSGLVKCAGIPSTIRTQVINSKHHESTVISVVPGIGENKILSTAQWKSATCPQDLK